MRFDTDQLQWLAMSLPTTREEFEKRKEIFIDQRRELFGLLHKRDGILNLSLEEKLSRAKGRLRNIKWEGVTFANPLLIASSSLTQSYDTIQQYLDQGAAGVVLKSAGDFQIMCECARARADSGCKLREAIPIYNTEGRGIFSSSSRSKHCERITLDEAQSLYEKIKKGYPEAVVISSFGPEKEEDFGKLDQLPGDIIEVTPRYFRKDYEKPLAYFWWTNDNTMPEDEPRVQNHAKFVEHQRKVLEILHRQIPKIKRPTLYKVVGFEEIGLGGTQDNILSTGFTIGDSKKRSHMYSNNGVSVHEASKGSWSGDILFADTLNRVKSSKERAPQRFVSWSGGIFTPDDALSAVLYGAETVQICSAVYLHGAKAVGRIVRAFETK